MTTTTATRTTATRPLLIPTGDPTPVEKAAVDGILDMFEPETFLWITFHRPDGGAHCWYAWTTGGPDLGDQGDQLALAAHMDAADWFAITGRYGTEHTRGRIRTTAYPLRPILADIQAGRGDDGDLRRRLDGFVKGYCAETHQPDPDTRTFPRWMGVGPRLVGRQS
jgi:hypothetical protein